MHSLSVYLSRPGERIQLAVYTPRGGWHVFNPDLLARAMAAWDLEKVKAQGWGITTEVRA